MQGANDDPNGDGQAKYTCRYDIQIPNDKEFQVARRLIGAKGCNMKRIIQECCKNLPTNQEVVKLRLRGKGSGFKEGPKQEESKEPLHLCISSRFYPQYMTACNKIENLLLNVYEEYKKHCERQRRDIKPVNPGGILQIKKYETVTGRRTQIQSLPNIYAPNSTSAQQYRPTSENLGHHPFLNTLENNPGFSVPTNQYRPTMPMRVGNEF